MPVKNIIPGQQVSPKKLQRSRELRGEMTPAEKILWQELRGHRLGGYHFRRQQIIAGFIVDFFCQAKDMVIEVDGEIHQSQKEYDVERDKILAEMGLCILRFSNQDIFQNLPQVLKKIAELCSKS